MGTWTPAMPDSLVAELIAPCGMNCGLCSAHLRDRNRCAGCNSTDEASKPHYCVVCRIRNCDELAGAPGAFCSSGCTRFPCARLRQLDKRYRARYRMSMIENLEELRRIGVEAFVVSEKARWACEHCGAVISVHKDVCLACGGTVAGSHGAGMDGAAG